MCDNELPPDLLTEPEPADDLDGETGLHDINNVTVRFRRLRQRMIAARIYTDRSPRGTCAAVRRESRACAAGDAEKLPPGLAQRWTESFCAQPQIL